MNQKYRLYCELSNASVKSDGFSQYNQMNRNSNFLILLIIRNSSGSTPLHLAAGTGHVAVVSYLLTQRSGQAVKAALDNDGKSPLAVCLDSKMNDWTKTARILKDAYSNSVSSQYL